jgi:hypothetical protein
VTESISDHGVGNASSGDKAGATEGPDPAIGAGITLLGIFLMGAGGARDAHYVFDVGVLTGVVGAGLFVLFVALSAMRRKAPLPPAGPSAARSSAP